MILGNNTTDKSDKSGTVGNVKSFYIDQADLVVQLIHMLGTLVQVNDRPVGLSDGPIGFLKQMFGFSLTFITCYNLHHIRVLLEFIDLYKKTINFILIIV